MRRNIYLSFLILPLIIFSFFAAKEIKAGTEDSVSGRAMVLAYDGGWDGWIVSFSARI